MKALSVRQPWASLIASGQKTIEVRSWKTLYRGPLLICASRSRCNADPTLPRGVAVCLVDLCDCRPFVPDSDTQAACFPGRPEDFAWVLSNPRPIHQFPVLGRLSLFEVDLPATIDGTHENASG